MNLLSFTDQEIEDLADSVTVEVLRGLVSEGVLTFKLADEWCGLHTVRMRRKTLWRTLTDRWLKESPTKDSFYFIVVKSI